MKYIINIITLLFATFFLSCNEENTQDVLIADIASISIDGGDTQIYSTDLSTTLLASVNFTNGRSSDITDFVDWVLDNDDTLYLDQNIITPKLNGGSSVISINYKENGGLGDAILVDVHQLTSFFISSDDINSTGTYSLEAKGSFDNNETNRTILSNITWTANNNATLYTNVETGVTTITILAGVTNLTATMFGETNSSSPIAPQSVIYTIN